MTASLPGSSPHALRPALLAALLGALLAACDGGETRGAASTGDSTATGRDPALEVIDLVTAVKPLSATAGAGTKNDWHVRRRETLERLRRAGKSVGLEALRAYRDRPEGIVEVRIGLLDVAAHAAPEETRETLVELVETFGDEMGVRTAAADLLGKTSPERAIEVIEPILRGQRTGRTYPPVDRLLIAWFEAMKGLEQDPVPVLCMLATDMTQDIGARNFATKRLGEHPSEQGRQALEQLLVESTGNHMIRRFAAQSLQRTMDPDAFCALIHRTLDREADLAYQSFLDNLLVAHCR